jgi:hypothetical protein
MIFFCIEAKNICVAKAIKIFSNEKHYYRPKKATVATATRKYPKVINSIPFLIAF